MRFSITFSAAAALLFACASAHSWVEQMQVIDDQGKFIGAPGYSRGYVPRSGTFSDISMSYLLPPNAPRTPPNLINNEDFLCRQEQRQPNKNSQDYPQLRALPGSFVAAKYLENGHVTMPGNQVGKPGSGGLVYMYATTNPKPNMKLPDIFKWGPTDDLSKGRLLAVNTFDDGRCYQLNDASPISMDRRVKNPNPLPNQPGSNHELWCETDFQIPKDAKAGSMAVYWVWQWPSLAGFNGAGLHKDEIYTTCSDISIVTDQSTIVSAVSGKQLENPDPVMVAVSNFKERAANVTLPTIPDFYGSNPNSAAGSSSAPGSPAPSLSATSAPAPSSVPGSPGNPIMSFITSTRTVILTVTRSQDPAGATSVSPTDATSAAATNATSSAITPQGRSAKFRA
jgi:hypothetical protein